MNHYYVQVGYLKGSYKDRFGRFESYEAALGWYNNLNTHSGHKKRIVNQDGKVLLRLITKKVY